MNIKMTTKRNMIVWLACAIAVLFMGVHRAQASPRGEESGDSPVFTTFDAPNAISTRARAINSEGDMVGFYRDTGGNVHGFLLSSDGGFTSIDVPVAGAKMTEALGINDRGDIVGQYTSADGKVHGFLLSHDDDFTSLDPLNSMGTSAHAINDRSDIVGLIDLGLHGFLLSRHGTATQIDVPLPGVTDTQAYSINNGGVVAGSFSDAAGGHGFVRSRDGDSGDYEQVDFPLAAPGSTQLFGNNNRGDVVGCWGDAGRIHAWLRTGEGFTSFDAPDSQQKYTVAWGINSQGDIVGEYRGSDNKLHAFLRSKSKED